MLDLLIAGARVSLLIGFCAAAISAIIGGTVGILSGFFGGGKTDTVLMRTTDYFLVIGRPADHRDQLRCSAAAPGTSS